MKTSTWEAASNYSCQIVEKKVQYVPQRCSGVKVWSCIRGIWASQCFESLIRLLKRQSAAVIVPEWRWRTLPWAAPSWTAFVWSGRSVCVRGPPRSSHPGPFLAVGQRVDVIGQSAQSEQQIWLLHAIKDISSPIEGASSRRICPASGLNLCGGRTLTSQR